MSKDRKRKSPVMEISFPMTEDPMKKKERNFVLKPIEVTEDHLDSILTGAFEGGSNYWIAKVEVKKDDFKGKVYASESVAAGGELYIYTTDDAKYLLSKSSIIMGLQQYLDTSKLKNWPDGGDAETDDLILQYALFGEVVYG